MKGQPLMPSVVKRWGVRPDEEPDTRWIAYDDPADSVKGTGKTAALAVMDWRIRQWRAAFGRTP